MPSKFTPRVQIADDATIGTRKSANAEYWYLRVHWKNVNRHHFVSLKIRYEGLASEKLARVEAEKQYRRMKESIRAGIQPNLKLTPEFIRKEYLLHIRDRAEENEALTASGATPVHLVEGGRGYWSIKRYLDAKAKIGRTPTEKRTGYSERDTSEPALAGPIEIFFEDNLPQELHKIRQRDLEKFVSWAYRKYQWAPATVNRALVQIRMMWRHAHNKGYVDFVPTLSQQPQQLIERTRRKLKADEYAKIIEESRKRYETILQLEERDRDYSKLDLYYQFHLWVLIMSNSGIRPPAGGEERLLIKWSDIHARKNGEERFLLRRSEKAHLNYEAVILPNAHEYLDALKELQNLRGVTTDYVFAHTTDNEAVGGKGWSKGEPIKSFKRQWNTVLKMAGLSMPAGTPQNQKLVPYSLRAWFMTNRLEASDTLRIEDLSKATGSSPEIISKLYYDYNTRKRYDQLTEGVLDRSELKPVYVDGLYVGRTQYNMVDKVKEQFAKGPLR